MARSLRGRPFFADSGDGMGEAAAMHSACAASAVGARRVVAWTL
jgi:hypothetical protein